MSKKKLLLASAVFAAGVFTASCGGGGGGGTTSTTPTPPPPPPPAPNEVAKVVVGAVKGMTSPGALVGYYEGTIYDNGTVDWSEISTPFDTMLEYVHEFSNGNVLLASMNYSPPTSVGYAPTNMPYLYDPNAGTITPLTGPCTVFHDSFNVAHQIYLPNFVIVDESPGVGNPDVDYIITANGACVAFGAVGAGGTDQLLYAGKNYVVVASSNNVFIVDRNGNTTQLDGDLATAGTNAFGGTPYVYDRVDGKDIILIGADVAAGGGAASPFYVILEDGTPVPLMNVGNTATGDDPMWDVMPGNAKLIQDNNGNIYVGIVGRIVADPGPPVTYANALEYFKVIPAGPASQVFSTAEPIYQTATNLSNQAVPFYDPATPVPAEFDIAGDGTLYAIADCNDPGGVGGTDQSNFNAANPSYELISLSWTPNNNLLGPTCMENPIDPGIDMADGGQDGTQDDPWQVVAFSSSALVTDARWQLYTSATALHTTGSVLTNIALTQPLFNALTECAYAKDNEYWTFGPYELRYTDTTTEFYYGGGTDTVSCVDFGLYGWLVADGSNGVYNGNNYLAANTYWYHVFNGDTVLMVDPTTGVDACTPGTLTSGATCTSYSLDAPAPLHAYGWDPTGHATSSFAPFGYKIKSDTNVISDGADFSYATIISPFAGFAPNVVAAYFGGTISSPYLLDLSTGNADVSSIPFATTGLPARGGNINLDMDRVANVFSPIGGACASLGYFDEVWYEDNNFNFTVPRPDGTCLFNVINVRTP